MNPIRPRNAKLQVAKLPKMLKPDTGGIETSMSPPGLSGWLGMARGTPSVQHPPSIAPAIPRSPGRIVSMV